MTSDIKTTICGIIAAVPQIALNIFSDPAMVETVKTILPPKYANLITALGIMAGLYFARDKKNSDSKVSILTQASELPITKSYDIPVNVNLAPEKPQYKVPESGPSQK
jgi:hypothetical protein